MAFTVFMATGTVGLNGGSDPAVMLKVDGRGSANVSIAAQGRFVSVVWAAATDGGVSPTLP